MSTTFINTWTAPPSVDSKPATSWPLQRILFLLAGTVTLSGIILGVFVNHWFLLLPTLAGANQLLMVAVGWCPMSVLLTRLGIASGSCGAPAPPTS